MTNATTTKAKTPAIPAEYLQANGKYIPGYDARHAGQVARSILETGKQTRLAELPTEALKNKALNLVTIWTEKAQAKAERDAERAKQVADREAKREAEALAKAEAKAARDAAKGKPVETNLISIVDESKSGDPRKARATRTKAATTK